MSDTNTNEVPEVWSHEEDTYTATGQQLLDDIESAVGKIVAPLMAAGADTAHVGSIVIEAAGRAVNTEWNRRQDHP